jgi:hypothetical protein
MSMYGAGKGRVHGELSDVARQSRWRRPYCLIQKYSRTVRALPHQNAPVAASHCQSAPDRSSDWHPKDPAV